MHGNMNVKFWKDISAEILNSVEYEYAGPSGRSF